MAKFLYTFIIHLYKFSIGFLSIYHKKAKLKIDGIQTSKSLLADFKNKEYGDIVFIHCSSQGEHEQAKPIIRWIISNTDYSILITFFSPSGFINANTKDSSRITKAYLPFDTPKEISNFVTLIRPKVAIIIKNEWWWNLIYTLKEKNIPTYLVSATFRKEHYFIKLPNQFFTKALQSFSKLFVVDENSKNEISKILKSNIVVSGDTRIDQVNYLKEKNHSEANMIHCNDLDSKQIIVYGSVWDSDIESIKELIVLYPEAVHLIYPHELSSENIKKLKIKIPHSKLLSHTKEIHSGTNIITSMGELKYAYRLASLAYIGGGFGDGIHNILEAAVYYIPTLFGPSFQKSNEAKYLLSKNCAFTFKEVNELKNISAHIKKEKNRNEIESNLKAYFSPDLSPTTIICKEIF
jgi:3-deoxy-D-manno-octulosonic-acid transferase